MTTTEIDKETTKKVKCSKCGGVRNCGIKGHYQKTEGNEDVQFWTEWFILECMGCNYTFFMRSDTNTEDVDFEEDPSGGFTQVLNPDVSYWPALSKRETPNWFHAFSDSEGKYSTLRVPLLELYGALNNDLLMLAAIGVRTCFDVASGLCNVDEGLPFQKKLTALVQMGKIGSVDQSRLGVLVDAGGASAHRGWIPTEEQLATLVDLLEHFIFEAFVSPETKAGLDVKATALKAKVPPRKKAAKKKSS